MLHHLASKLPDRTTHVLIGAEAAAGSEKRHAIGFSYVGAFHQHIQSCGVTQQFRLVIVHSVCVVVVPNAVVVMTTKAVKRCAVAQHVCVSGSVLSE